MVMETEPEFTVSATVSEDGSIAIIATEDIGLRENVHINIIPVYYSEVLVSLTITTVYSEKLIQAPRPCASQVVPVLDNFPLQLLTKEHTGRYLSYKTDKVPGYSGSSIMVVFENHASGSVHGIPTEGRRYLLVTITYAGNYQFSGNVRLLENPNELSEHMHPDMHEFQFIGRA